MNKLDNKYFEIILKELSTFFADNGFKKSEDGFKSDKLAVKIEYNEEKHLFNLLTANLENETLEYSIASSYLFDDSSNEEDAVAVGIDFLNTLRDISGIKAKRVTGADQIDLPTNKGCSDVSGFTKKVLDVFPQLKEEYKQSVAEHGKFLYMNFFAVNLVPLIKSTIKDGNKKQVKKLFDLIEQGFINGDKDTSDIALAVTAAAVYKDEKLKAAAIEASNCNEHLKSALISFIPAFEKDKKLTAALIK